MTSETGPVDTGHGGDPAHRRPRRPSGRRRGDSGTRQAILDAAREQFAAQGYQATTVRGIAGAAGVDPSLINHFYGGKRGLFAATLDIPAEVPRRMAATLGDDGDTDTLGERFVRMYLALWEDVETAEPVRALVRSAIASDEASALLEDFLRAQILHVVVPALHTDRAELRATLAASHLLGTALARYVVHVSPVADLDREDLIAILAPTIQRYLTAELPGRGP
jgi:AcrR family transcriptional regulator